VSGAAGATLPDQNTDILLGPEDVPDAAAAPSSAPVVDEAAILYANDQLDAAALLLRTSLHDHRAGAGERLPWWMLFDLYQIMGREHEFESIAIDYASHFETSPPTYHTVAEAAQAPDRQFSGIVPTANLSGCLDDDAATRAQLARAQADSPSPLVRFEFQAIAAVTPSGCALLLDTLQAMRKAERELVLAGADQLVAMLRPMLAIGDRGAGEAPWLLLLELLLLTNREKDFEETAMDYCVTFEVSPPSFEAPPRAAVSLGAGPATAGDRFLLPPVIQGDNAALLGAIADHAARHPVLVLDGSRLARIDYTAANALAAHVRTLAGEGRDVVLRDLNHLVAALLRLLGVGEEVRLYTHKY
jgi:ABC-type transporter Mla MlaB component